MAGTVKAILDDKAGKSELLYLFSRGFTLRLDGNGKYLIWDRPVAPSLAARLLEAGMMLKLDGLWGGDQLFRLSKAAFNLVFWERIRSEEGGSKTGKSGAGGGLLADRGKGGKAAGDHTKADVLALPDDGVPGH